MRKLVALSLTVLALSGAVSAEKIEKNNVLKHLDKYAHNRRIPKEVAEKIVVKDLGKVQPMNSCERCDHVK